MGKVHMTCSMDKFLAHRFYHHKIFNIYLDTLHNIKNQELQGLLRNSNRLSYLLLSILDSPLHTLYNFYPQD